MFAIHRLAVVLGSSFVLSIRSLVAACSLARLSVRPSVLGDLLLRKEVIASQKQEETAAAEQRPGVAVRVGRAVYIGYLL